MNHLLTHSLTGVKCRATSVAKNVSKESNLIVLSISISYQVWKWILSCHMLYIMRLLTFTFCYTLCNENQSDCKKVKVLQYTLYNKNQSDSDCRKKWKCCDTLYIMRINLIVSPAHPRAAGRRILPERYFVKIWTNSRSPWFNGKVGGDEMKV